MPHTDVRVTVDLVVLTVRDDELAVLLVRRGIAPFRGRLALPGGFVLDREDLEAAAVRELEEETGIRGLSGHLEQLATFGKPGRDPRGRVVTVSYLALVPDPGPITAGSDAASAAWHTVRELDPDDRRLAFDHAQILAVGLERARAKLEYSTLATSFCPAEFTIQELRRVYEAVWGVGLDPRNFHRKVTGTPGFVEATGTTTGRQGGRPAQLFRTGTAVALHPAMLRPAD
jgi:8-oxo-dGTP diphosphatase